MPFFDSHAITSSRHDLKAVEIKWGGSGQDISPGPGMGYANGLINTAPVSS